MVLSTFLTLCLLERVVILELLVDLEYTNRSGAAGGTVSQDMPSL